MAYFCDGERGFLDPRLQLYDGAAADYVTVRKALSLSGDEESSPNEPPPPEGPWRTVLAKRKVRYVILYNESSRQLRTAHIKALRRMLYTPAEFTPLYANGDVYVFGWNAPQQKPLPQWATMRPLTTTGRRSGRPRSRWSVPTRRMRPTSANGTKHCGYPKSRVPRRSNLTLFHQLSQDARQGAWQQEEFNRMQATVGTAGFALGLSGTHAFFQPNIRAAYEAGLDPRRRPPLTSTSAKSSRAWPTTPTTPAPTWRWPGRTPNSCGAPRSASAVSTPACRTSASRTWP